MKSNIDKTRRAIENRPETKSVSVDGNQTGAILRALVDGYDSDFESFLEDELDVTVQSAQYVGFGTEVEVY